MKNEMEYYSLRMLSQSASMELTDTEGRLARIEDDLLTRMEGRTLFKSVFSIIFTLLWLVAFGYLFNYAWEQINNAFVREVLIDYHLYKITLITCALLIVTMLVDEIIDLSFCRKLSRFKRNIKNLKSRVQMGNDSLDIKLESFMDSSNVDWEYPFALDISVLEALKEYESTITNIEARKTGFINGLKNFLYFSAVILVTCMSGVLLTDFVFGTMVPGMGTEMRNVFNDENAVLVSFFATCVAGAMAVLLAKQAWAKHNCKVTNIALYVLPLSPVLYFLGAFAVTFCILIVIGIIEAFKWIFSSLLKIIGMIIGGGILLLAIGAAAGG